MRDPNRINHFFDVLKEAWKQNPNLRFGQLIWNLSQYVKFKYKKDVFYVEDDELLEIIKKYFHMEDENEKF